MEDARILERLVFTFRDAEQYDLGVFPEIVTRGTNQVADVFDEENVDVIEVPVRERFGDHAGIQMTCAAGRDLLYRKAGAGEEAGVVFSLNVAREHCDLCILGH